MNKWRFVGYNHLFTYNAENGFLGCSCGDLGTRVSRQQSIPVSERHVRARTKTMGSLVIEDLS